MARLDRLGPAKEVIQVGAVIGSEFSYELLHAVHPSGEAELQAALRNLTDAELLYVRGIAPDATYQFKHALIREAAYEALLKSRRKELHLTVARTIDDKFPALKETQPELPARHWTEAGETERAFAAWSRAGKVAESRNAFKEALANYQQATAMLNRLPESPEHDGHELKLRLSVVSMLYLTKGYSAPETVEAVGRAAPLAEKSGNMPHLVSLIVSRGLTALFLGDLSAAGALADRALELALRDGSRSSLESVHNLQQMTRYWRGDLLGVEKHFTEALRISDSSAKQSSEAAVRILAYGSWNAWVLGRANVARERMSLMLAATNGNSPTIRMFSEYHAAYLRILPVAASKYKAARGPLQILSSRESSRGSAPRDSRVRVRLRIGQIDQLFAKPPKRGVSTLRAHSHFLHAR
jgi:tetratricopeptide (TPR) repeat protein